MRLASVVFLAVCLLSPAAAARKVGVLPVEAGAGVDKKVAAALTEATAGALAKTGVDVITQAQIKALLDHEAQKRLAGCSDDVCVDVPAGASFFGPRWQRRLFAIARDDDMTYFVVDRAREPDDNKDFRLYVGKKGKLAPLSVDDVALESDETVLVTPQGKLRLAGGAEWASTGASPLPLKALDLEDDARMAYTELGLYDEPLGTPCDAVLGSAR
jgi:hypothetical protein